VSSAHDIVARDLPQTRVVQFVSVEFLNCVRRERLPGFLGSSWQTELAYVYAEFGLDGTDSTRRGWALEYGGIPHFEW
jgi:hypothetical protein